MEILRGFKFTIYARDSILMGKDKKRKELYLI